MARQNVMTGGGANAPAKKQAEEGSKRDVEEKAGIRKTSMRGV